MAPHEGFGEGLAALQLGAFLSGSHDHEFRMLSAIQEVVHQSLDKRGFGTDHDHVDAVLSDAPAYGIVVGDVQFEVGGHLGSAGIAGWPQKVG